MTQWVVMIQEPIKAMLFKIWSYIPNLVASLIILLVGWVVAKVLEQAIVRLLSFLKIDVAAEKSGVSDILQKGEIRKSVSELLGAIVYWLVMLVVIATSIQTLHLLVATELLARLVDYVPSIIAAIFVLVLGGFLASFIGAIVQTAAGNARIRRAPTLAQLSRVVIFIFTIAVALEQLKIGLTVIAYAVNILVAAIGLGFAIAFGLGCKDLVGRWVDDFIKSLKS